MMQHKGKMPHTCQLCGLSFAYKCKLTRHMTTHEDMAQRKTFQCLICGKGFAYGKSVTVHMKKVSKLTKINALYSCIAYIVLTPLFNSIFLSYYIFLRSSLVKENVKVARKL